MIHFFIVECLWVHQYVVSAPILLVLSLEYAGVSCYLLGTQLCVIVLPKVYCTYYVTRVLRKLHYETFLQRFLFIYFF